MSTKITNVAPNDEALEILELGVVVAGGDSIEVEDADLARRLLQSPNWEGKPSKTANKETPEGETN